MDNSYVQANKERVRHRNSQPPVVHEQQVAIQRQPNDPLVEIRRHHPEELGDVRPGQVLVIKHPAGQVGQCAGGRKVAWVAVRVAAVLNAEG